MCIGKRSLPLVHALSLEQCINSLWVIHQQLLHCLIIQVGGDLWETKRRKKRRWNKWRKRRKDRRVRNEEKGERERKKGERMLRMVKTPAVYIHIACL